jgi:predicted nuclease of predicted toxin-antitoxin system
LITQDKDFGELVYRLKKAHFGIILIRLGSNDAYEKGRITTFAILEYREKLTNAFTAIQPNAIRIRHSRNTD